MSNFEFTQPSIPVSTQCIARWFTAVRDANKEDHDRVLECFWDTQLSAKAWLIRELSGHCPMANVTAYIFGGWYGILASMMMESFSNRIDHLYSIDIDPGCESMVKKINYPYFGVIAVTSDMAQFDYPWEHTPTIVINTSTEHVEQGIYDTWFDKIPHGTTIVAQGNNYYECREHVRCCKNLREFQNLNHVIDPLYCDELENPQYTRYMAIWRK
jgi:hypothetical protein